MNLILVIVVSTSTALITSFLIMKLQMKMIERWMDIFFDQECERIKSMITIDRLNRN